MNLPVRENAVVWKSDPNEFRAIHKDDKKNVTKDYTDKTGRGANLTNQATVFTSK